MIENHRYSNDAPPFSEKGIKPKNYFSQEAVMSRNIHSYFQLAKKIVTKVHEIETQKTENVALARLRSKLQ